MNNENFLCLIPGSIGYINYYISSNKNIISESEKQKKIDKLVNSLMNSYIKEYSITGTTDKLPHDFFGEARIKAKKEVEKEINFLYLEKKSLYLQINNNESYKKLLDIEKKSNFHSWSMPGWVKDFKENHIKNYKK